jgi:hypothetical protein
MRKISLLTEKDESIEFAEELLLLEAKKEKEKSIDDVSDLNIIPFYFMDKTIPRRSGETISPEKFESIFNKYDRTLVLTTPDYVVVYLSTTRTDLEIGGYEIYDSVEFQSENPFGLYKVWMSILSEIQNGELVDG